MKTSKIKAIVFGLAFFTEAMMFGGGSAVNAQASVEPNVECEMTQDCSDAGCSILNAKKRFMANGCK